MKKESIGLVNVILRKTQIRLSGQQLRLKHIRESNSSSQIIPQSEFAVIRRCSSKESSFNLPVGIAALIVLRVLGVGQGHTRAPCRLLLHESSRPVQEV